MGNTVFIKDIPDVKKFKKSKGPDIQVWGSSRLVQLLLKNDLADELKLKTHPTPLEIVWQAWTDLTKLSQWFAKVSGEMQELE